MRNYSFDVNDHHGMMAKLEAEYADFDRDTLSSRHAINFATTAYHCREWVWEHEPTVRQSYASQQDFNQAVNNACPSMRIMRDLTNGSKHAKITQGRSVVKDTELHRGVFSREFSREFDTTHLLVTLEDGSKRSFDLEARAVMEFWRKAFASNFRIGGPA